MYVRAARFSYPQCSNLMLAKIFITYVAKLCKLTECTALDESE